MKFNQWTLGLMAVLVIMLASAVRAQNTNSFPPFSTALTNYIPTTANFATRIDIRAGYGVNLTSHDPIAAAAVSVSLSPSLALGGVVSRDSTGWCAGGVTLGINGSAHLPLIGRIDMFAGDGVAYDFKYHCAANYLFVGVERPFFYKKFRIAPGVSLANTSTRAGTNLLLGLGIGF